MVEGNVNVAGNQGRAVVVAEAFAGAKCAESERMLKKNEGTGGGRYRSPG